MSTHKRRLCAATAAAIAAFSPGAVAQEGDVVVERRERVIQWPAGVASLTATAARVYPEGAAEAFAACPIPVLAPAGLAEADRIAFTDSFRALGDGYFAVISRGAYDVIINGTRSYAVSPELTKIIERDGFRYVYEEGTTGVSISFNRFGGDYLLQFECLALAPGENDCVGEDEAVAFADSLIIIGGGGS